MLVGYQQDHTFTDFREYQLDYEPTDWVKGEGTEYPNVRWQVKQDLTMPSGKALRLVQADNYESLVWNRIAPTNDLEALTLMQIPSYTENYRSVGVRVNETDGYFVGVDNTPSHNFCPLVKFLNEEKIILAQINKTFVGGDRIWTRIRAQGIFIMAKLWRDGTAEPADWDAKVSDQSFAVGQVGTRIGTPLYGLQEHSIGYVSIATGGHVAL